MPRHPRINEPGLLFHVFSRGNNKQKIFLEKEDYSLFLGYLARTKKKYPFKLFAYMLMPNHFHLLMETGPAGISRAMQSLLTGYSQHFSRKYDKVGHLFQGRFKSVICEKETYFLELIRYIHLNPVRKGLADKPGSWEWGSHREYAGKSPLKLVDKELVQNVFGSGEKGYSQYKSLLEDAVGSGIKEDLYPGEANPFMGSDDFVSGIAQTAEPARKKTKPLTVLLEDVCGKLAAGVKKKNRRKDVARARRAFIKAAVREQKYGQKEVADFLKCDEGYVSRIVNENPI